MSALEPPSSAAAPLRVFVALGSNLGDSRAILQQALDRLQTLSTTPLRRSSFWLTAPIDCPPGSPSFINAVAELQPPLLETPDTLLAKLQSIEAEFGRRPKTVLNEPRPLDLDLIAFGDQVRQTPRLILPHPRAAQRRFVLAPLAELAPELRLPGNAKTVRQLLEALGSDQPIQRL